MNESDLKREVSSEILEALVQLYLRLNGYFCIGNYLYHRSKLEIENGLVSESDVLAMRMPNQVEVLSDGTEQRNDPLLLPPSAETRPDCVIGEVKEREVDFNNPIKRDGGEAVIASALRMFGLLPHGEFEEGKLGSTIAARLRKQVLEQAWSKFPYCDEDHRLFVRMIVFARRDAKKANNRTLAFIPLEHLLEWVRDRMKPGQICSPYTRSNKFSPWHGITRVVVDFLDASYEMQPGPSLDDLLSFALKKLL
jgi:hypothetical protein